MSLTDRMIPTVGKEMKDPKDLALWASPTALISPSGTTPGGLAFWTWWNAPILESGLGQAPEHGKGTYTHNTLSSLSTAIGLRKYRIPSDLRSQAEYRLVSTTVGDHVGILGAVVFVIASGRANPAWVGDT